MKISLNAMNHTKYYLLLLIVLFYFLNVTSQTYNNPGGTIVTCSGNFYDSGGQFGNYSNNQNTVTTFCGTGGYDIAVAISLLNLRNNDILTIYDGPNTSSPVLYNCNGCNVTGNLSSTSGCLTFAFTSNGSGVDPGWAMAISCLIPGCTNPAASNYNPAATLNDGSCTFPGVDYVHPTQGGAGEFVGACLVNDCGPFVYTDDGGPSGNYSLNIGQPGFGGIYRVFCPDQAGQCMRVTFNSFSTELGFDYMTIGNGPTQNSPFFTTPPAPATGQISGNPAAPFSYTSTDASGCLTFRFFSDNTVTAAGWNATLQCLPCAGGPNGTDNNDCATLIALCSGTSFGANSTGPGLSSDGCTFGQCPAGGENFSNWYAFQVFSSGTLDITVTPQVATDDYDFAVYGPGATCANLGDPIRCSDAAATGITGTGGDTDLSEPAAGNGQVATMNVLAGEFYYLVVDEWTPTGAGFNLAFGGTASLDCTVLPVELSEFTADYVPHEGVVDLFWKTASERDNDFWEVERSTDGINWEVIDKVKGAGTTNYETQYYVVDPNPFIGVNYYRLVQWDINGNGKNSELRSVNILDDFYDMLSLFPNPTNDKTEVIYNSYTTEPSILTVTDAEGKVVVNTPIDTKKGGNRFELDMSGQSRGVYVVTITTRDKVYRTKLVKE